MILHDAATIRRWRQSDAWGDVTIDDLLQRNAAATPGAIAIVDAPNRPDIDGHAPRRLTYGEYVAETDRLAGRLLGLGLGKDSLVVIQMPNTVDLILLIQACARIGAIVSPMPMQYGAHEVGQILETLGAPDCAFTCAAFQGRDQARRFQENIARRAPHLPVVVFGLDDSDGDLIAISKVRDLGPVALAEHRRSQPISADDIFTICWTSGTTAEPKGVPRSHNNWIWHGQAVVDTGGCRPGETVMTPFPAVNMGGFGSALLPWWITGGKLVLHHPFDLALYARQIEEEQVGVVLGAPAILTSLLKAEEILARHDISCLHAAPSGSAPLSPWLIVEFELRFGIKIVNQFGSNEGTTLVADVQDVPDPVERASYFSRIGVHGLDWSQPFTRWVSTRLVDVETGEKVSRLGQPGELHIRSPSIFPGYFNRPDLTAEVLDADGFFATGDLFEIATDTHGEPRFYRFIGRAKDLIIRGGFNIAPPEIEAVIQSHPAVAEVAVVGDHDDRLGERVCAFVVTQAGARLTLEEIIDLFRAADVARFKWPERLEIVDALPRNPIGKVVKSALKTRLIAPRPQAGAA